MSYASSLFGATFEGGGPKDIYEYQNISKYELWVNDHILQIPVIK